MTDPQDHGDPGRVIPTLDHEGQLLAQHLLASGFRTVSAWGPVQMAVAHLRLQRGDLVVDLDTERGVTAIAVRRGDLSVPLLVANYVRSRPASTADSVELPAGWQQQFPFDRAATIEWLADAKQDAIRAVAHLSW
ncbi:hypothetical protein [Aeromicrobium stalagmiti]|uniref:hypothetical protein n=1 Tax=Aeromicrobium stalagmiti TaxID=2738988 RepID=UPI0015682513|nr:hypothetical protein [Aeromicrobium stalagmiti]NRQ51374.1 hypothetical protein [Aeromicrobium stalagmiti]